jgi:two-component system, LuxR family, response regulator FixJ
LSQINAVAAHSAIYGPNSISAFQRDEMALQAETPRIMRSAPPPVVVVVDQDAAVRSSLKFSLELEGFSVRVYGNAADFLDARLEEADCLVIEQRVPAMTGIELIGKLRARNIATPAVLMVSQPNLAVSACAEKAHVPIVEKPFLGNALVDKIRQVCRPKTD